jgi:hypothetical protein
MDNNSYLPPQVSRELDKHVQANMPSYLKKYTGSDRPGYVPPNIEAAISKDVEQGLPSHLKKYASSYVNEMVSQPLQVTHPTAQTTTPPPIPNTLRRDHSLPFGEQQTVELNTLPEASKTLFQSPSGQAVVPQQLSNGPAQPPTTDTSQGGGYHQNYEFIMNSGEQPKQKFSMPSLPGSHSLFGRIALGVGGLLVLVVVISVISSIFKGSSNYPYLLSVVQDQEEITHLSNEANAESDISSANQTFTSTVNLVLNNSATELMTYMKANGHTVSLASANLKENKTLDTDLNTAESAGSLNGFFTENMTNQMNQYTSDLSTAYNHTSGVHGKALLSSYYRQALLLKKVLSGNVDGDSST